MQLVGPYRATEGEWGQIANLKDVVTEFFRGRPPAISSARFARKGPRVPALPLGI